MRREWSNETLWEGQLRAYKPYATCARALSRIVVLSKQYRLASSQGSPMCVSTALVAQQAVEKESGGPQAAEKQAGESQAEPCSYHCALSSDPSPRV